MKELKFEELNLSADIEKAVQDMGFEVASPIQAQAIPVLLEGKDVIGQAQTGTGKTVAFGIPTLEMIDASQKATQAVILCPTRELTIQVAEEFAKLAKYKKGINIVPIYGGQSYERQFSALKKGPQVIIGTPGRLMDHMERGTVNLENVKMFVLDEADEMLNMGFVEDIETILDEIPEERQTVFFSATMPKQIMALTKKYQTEPQLVKVVHQELTVPNIEQLYFEVKDSMKLEVLCRLIDVYNVKLGLIFCNTKRRVDELLEQLQARGYLTDSLHGDMKQNQRELVMRKFRNGQTELLIATDVAARGIDVDDIEAVFNYDIPYDEEYYVHRIGRTGRAGKKGKAFTFVSGREIYKLKDIQRYTKSKMTLNKIPSLVDVEATKINAFIERLKTKLEADENGNEKYVDIVEKLMVDDYTATEIAAVLIKMNLGLSETSGEDELAKYERIRGGDRKLTGNTVRLFISVGRKDKVSPKDIVGALAGETGVPGDMIGKIDIMEKFTFVDVPEEHATSIINIMSKSQIKGKNVNLEVASAKPEESGSKKRHRKGDDFSDKKSFGKSDFGDRKRSYGKSDDYADKKRSYGKSDDISDRKRGDREERDGNRKARREVSFGGKEKAAGEEFPVKKKYDIPEEFLPKKKARKSEEPAFSDDAEKPKRVRKKKDDSEPPVPKKSRLKAEKAPAKTSKKKKDEKPSRAVRKKAKL